MCYSILALYISFHGSQEYGDIVLDLAGNGSPNPGNRLVKVTVPGFSQYKDEVIQTILAQNSAAENSNSENSAGNNFGSQLSNSKNNNQVFHSNSQSSNSGDAGAPISGNSFSNFGGHQNNVLVNFNALPNKNVVGNVFHDTKNINKVQQFSSSPKDSNQIASFNSAPAVNSGASVDNNIGVNNINNDGIKINNNAGVSVKNNPKFKLSNNNLFKSSNNVGVTGINNNDFRLANDAGVDVINNDGFKLNNNVGVSSYSGININNNAGIKSSSNSGIKINSNVGKAGATRHGKVIFNDQPGKFLYGSLHFSEHENLDPLHKKPYFSIPHSTSSATNRKPFKPSLPDPTKIPYSVPKKPSKLSGIDILSDPRYETFIAGPKLSDSSYRTGGRRGKQNLVQNSFQPSAFVKKNPSYDDHSSYTHAQPVRKFINWKPNNEDSSSSYLRHCRNTDHQHPAYDHVLEFPTNEDSDAPLFRYSHETHDIEVPSLRDAEISNPGNTNLRFTVETSNPIQLRNSYLGPNPPEVGRSKSLLSNSKNLEIIYGIGKVPSPIYLEDYHLASENRHPKSHINLEESESHQPVSFSQERASAVGERIFLADPPLKLEAKWRWLA